MAHPTLQPCLEASQSQPFTSLADAFDAGAAQIVFLALPNFPESVAATILTADETERARRLVAPSVRRGFVGGRWLLRSAVATLASVEPRSLELQAGRFGKLFLAGHERLALSFNLSHSGDLVALALVRGRRVGIDIEAERPLTDLALLARRILGPRERERFETLPQNARGAALLAAWTRKEAVLKAIGTGISGGLSTVEVIADTVVAADETSATWWVHTLPMPPGFHGAIAIEGDIPRVGTWQALLQRESSA